MVAPRCGVNPRPRKRLNRAAPPADLADAYHATSYEVYCRPLTRLRIDQPGPGEAGLLANVHRAALLTACNPRSRELGAADNARRQRRLCRLLDRLDIAWISACGRPDGDQWRPEPSVLAMDLSPQLARALARHFDQWAYLWLERDAPVRLIWSD